MIRVAGHSRSTGSRVYPEDHAQPLFVGSCGYQHFMTRDFSIQRATGRSDYQLLYIYKGCGHFLLEGSWRVIPAGSLVLYRPHDPQIYTYYAKDNPEVAEHVENEVRDNSFKLMSKQAQVAAKAAGRAVDVSADDFDDGGDEG